MIANVMFAISPNSLINCPPMKARALAIIKKTENSEKKPVALEELLISNLAKTDALAKVLLS